MESSKIDQWELVVACVLSLLVVVLVVTILILNLIWRNNKYSLIIHASIYQISLKDSYIIILLFVASFIIRYIKAGSPRLSVIILIALLFFPLIPILAAMIISADAYHISTPTGVDVLCWVSTCLIT